MTISWDDFDISHCSPMTHVAINCIPHYSLEWKYYSVQIWLFYVLLLSREKYPKNFQGTQTLGHDSIALGNYFSHSGNGEWTLTRKLCRKFSSISGWSPIGNFVWLRYFNSFSLLSKEYVMTVIIYSDSITDGNY